MQLHSLSMISRIRLQKNPEQLGLGLAGLASSKEKRGYQEGSSARAALRCASFLMCLSLLRRKVWVKSEWSVSCQLKGVTCCEAGRALLLRIEQVFKEGVLEAVLNLLDYFVQQVRGLIHYFIFLPINNATSIFTILSLFYGLHIADFVPLFPSFFLLSSVSLPSLLSFAIPSFLDRSMQLPIIQVDYNKSMTPEQRSLALSKFITYLDTNPSRSTTRINDSLSDIEVDQSQLPQLQSVDELLHYHQDITGTITKTFRQVSDIMVHMRELKNRKANVQKIIDCATATVEVKRLSYGLGNDPKEVLSSLESYYVVKDKAKFVDRFIDRVQGHISEIEKEYQATFDAQMMKNNSNSIGELSKVLQLIRKHSHREASPDSLQQILDFCVGSVNKQFKKIEEELFAVPLVGSGESNYQFFDMAKTAMKVIVNLSSSCRVNVIKVSGEEGLVVVLRKLFEVAAGGVILELLMRLRKYYEVDKIALQSKFTLKEKDLKRLQPYFKEFVAIWNQLERLRLHLLAEVNEACPKKQELRAHLENIISSASFVEISSNAIQFMQAIMRYRFDKLLKSSPFVGGVCTIEGDFLKDSSAKALAHNPEAQDFLEETISRVSEGIQKALQTLNTLIISAIINFANHNLIYEDVFYSFNEMFVRTFNKLPSNDQRVQNAVVLVLNSLHAFPRALRTLLHINLPEEIPAERLKAELQEVVNNNEERALKVLETLIGKIVSAEWFRYQLGKDHEKTVEKWTGLESQCFSQFVQQASRVHAQLLKQTQFSKKYTQVSAFAFEKQVRGIVSYYEKHSHAILPNFTLVMDYIQVLLLEDQEDFQRLANRFSGTYSEAELKRIWNLRN